MANTTNTTSIFGGLNLAAKAILKTSALAGKLGLNIVTSVGSVSEKYGYVSQSASMADTFFEGVHTADNWTESTIDACFKASETQSTKEEEKPAKVPSTKEVVKEAIKEVVKEASSSTKEEEKPKPKTRGRRKASEDSK